MRSLTDFTFVLLLVIASRLALDAPVHAMEELPLKSDY